jgi:flagellar biosynthesis regulator FlbT
VLLTLITQDNCLLKALGRVEGLVTNDEEVRKLMLDREAWRSRMKMIVAANKEVDSIKSEESKIKCIKTRSAIVVI